MRAVAANASARVVRQLLDDAIRQLVADAIADGGMIHSGIHATRLADMYPGSGLTPDEIDDAIIEAAVSAGVTTEPSRPGSGRGGIAL